MRRRMMTRLDVHFGSKNVEIHSFDGRNVLATWRPFGDDLCRALIMRVVRNVLTAIIEFFFLLPWLVS